MIRSVCHSFWFECVTVCHRGPIFVVPHFHELHHYDIRENVYVASTVDRRPSTIDRRPSTIDRRPVDHRPSTIDHYS